MTENYFAQLNAIDVGEKVEQKNGLTYLSWAWAWTELKKRYPDASYTIYEDAEGRFYHTDGKTCWVKTGVTVNGIEHIEYLPVMDFKNNSILLEAVTSVDVNKAIQRSLTKAVARHGLGLYVYAGEDLPEGAEPAGIERKASAKGVSYHGEALPLVCRECGGEIRGIKWPNGTKQAAAEVAQQTGGLCAGCARKRREENGA